MLEINPLKMGGKERSPVLRRSGHSHEMAITCPPSERLLSQRASAFILAISSHAHSPAPFLTSVPSPHNYIHIYKRSGWISSERMATATGKVA
ncbi:hypothetical protein C0Q70_08389 [Pomacea canaliculata]|uniref:Uncharacterized protein n=1 Tax=Pomacea canaliculata TaxID=400727 RepID=A0A2T7PHP9_POMCA|nr:hypothetical protein C0Q70_08389 [Pomacea canaliculata]